MLPKKWISVFTLTALFAFSMHPLHISVTDIEYDEKAKSLEIMSRIFMDDLELTMRNRLNQPDLDIMAQGKKLDEMMAAYFGEKLRITLDNKLQKVIYLGHEADGDTYIFYIEVPNIRRWKNIRVSNTALMETHGDQSNLVHVKVRDDLKSMRLTKSNQTDDVSFDIK
jgi:hypothetical protein